MSQLLDKDNLDRKPHRSGDVWYYEDTKGLDVYHLSVHNERVVMIPIKTIRDYLRRLDAGKRVRKPRRPAQKRQAAK